MALSVVTVEKDGQIFPYRADFEPSDGNFIVGFSRDYPSLAIGELYKFWLGDDHILYGIFMYATPIKIQETFSDDCDGGYVEYELEPIGVPQTSERFKEKWGNHWKEILLDSK